MHMLTELTMDEQKYIIKMHLYLDRMEDTDSSLLVVPKSIFI